MDTSALTWILEDNIHIRPLVASEAATLHASIMMNREHLDRWLRWSNSIQTEADALATIAVSAAKQERGLGFHNGIWVGAELAGGVVCRDIEPLHRRAEIGYWLGRNFTGKGLATRAVIRMIDHLFLVTRLHRLEMQCGVDNVRSRAIPERLGFRLEGIMRESHWITTQFVDHALYGLLAREWAERSDGPVAGAHSFHGYN
jgi:ribosomal-protein-serine acetyltransferase